MSEIWLVRHAPVAVSGLCYGRLDVPTTCAAEEAAARIRGAAAGAAHRWERIWASPSERARAVGAALSQRLALPLSVDERLCELDFGEWEGKSHRVIEQEHPERYRRWLRDYETEGPPGGESATDLRRRVSEWLAERRREGRTVLAVTHGGVIRCARSLHRAAERTDWLESVDYLAPERAF